MTERTPYSNQGQKRQRAAEYNARYEAKRNRHRVEPLFQYITRLAMPEFAWVEHQARVARAKRRRSGIAAMLVTTLAATAGGAYDR